MRQRTAQHSCIVYRLEVDLIDVSTVGGPDAAAIGSRVKVYATDGSYETVKHYPLDDYPALGSTITVNVHTITV